MAHGLQLVVQGLPRLTWLWREKLRALGRARRLEVRLQWSLWGQGLEARRVLG